MQAVQSTYCRKGRRTTAFTLHSLGRIDLPPAHCHSQGRRQSLYTITHKEGVRASTLSLTRKTSEPLHYHLQGRRQSVYTITHREGVRASTLSLTGKASEPLHYHSQKEFQVARQTLQMPLIGESTHQVRQTEVALAAPVRPNVALEHRLPRNRAVPHSLPTLTAKARRYIKYLGLSVLYAKYCELQHDTHIRKVHEVYVK